MAFGKQSRATALLGIKSAPRRPASSIATVIAIALVVIVLLGFLSMGSGYQQVIQGAGSPDTAVILREGATSAQGSALTADQLALLEGAPGISRFDQRAALSPEVTVAVSVDRGKDVTPANLVVRGIAPESGFMARNIAIVDGRTPAPGTSELLVGRAALREFPGLRLGSTVKLGSATWTIVGIFTARGSVYESEARADLHVVQPIFNRNDTVQTVRADVGPSGLASLRDYLARNPQGAMVAKSEAEYFQSLARDTGKFIQKLGWPLALLMALGALAGAGNAMYTSVDSRSGEIVTLRTLGFGRTAIFMGVIAESLALATIGALIGVLVSWLAFNGLQTSTAASALGQVAFEFRITTTQIVQALVLAIGVGLIGGLLPAFNAARKPLALAGRE